MGEAGVRAGTAKAAAAEQPRPSQTETFSIIRYRIVVIAHALSFTCLYRG